MKIELWVSTDRVGSECRREIEVDDEDWAEMTAKERDEFMLDELWNQSMIEWGYEET